MTAPTAHQINLAKNAAAARKQVATTDTRTRDMNYLLADLATFDERIQRGSLATFAGKVEQSLVLGGFAELLHNGENETRVRESIKAYAAWLMLVADNAR